MHSVNTKTATVKTDDAAPEASGPRAKARLKGPLTIAAAAIGAFALAGCITPMQERHGFIPDEAQPSEIQAGEDTRTTVLAKLGSPSIEDSFDGSRWYYISTKREQIAYLNPKTTERTVTEIVFNEEGEVIEVNQHGIEAGQKVAYVNKTTPTRGRELSVIEQILGNVGRVPGTTGEEEGPGGGNR